MPIAMKCPHCAQPLTIPDEFAGQYGRCNHCKEKVLVPASQDGITFESTAGPDEVRVPVWQCTYCKEQMHLDALICPHCGRPGGIDNSFGLLGGLVGTAGGFVVAYFAVFANSEEEIDGFLAFICTGCVCSPLFYVFVLPGAVVGVVGGLVASYFAKRRIRASL